MCMFVADRLAVARRYDQAPKRSTTANAVPTALSLDFYYYQQNPKDTTQKSGSDEKKRLKERAAGPTRQRVPCASFHLVMTVDGVCPLRLVLWKPSVRRRRRRWPAAHPPHLSSNSNPNTIFLRFDWQETSTTGRRPALAAVPWSKKVPSTTSNKKQTIFFLAWPNAKRPHRR